MTALRLFALAVVAHGCATTPDPIPPPAAAPPVEEEAAPAENPNVYTYLGVDVFGSRTYPKDELLANLGLPEPGTQIDVTDPAFGKMLQESKAKFTARFPFAFCRYSVAGYPADKTLRITIDVVDPGDEWRMQFTPSPLGDRDDPAGLIAAWNDYRKAYWALQQKGELPAAGPGADAAPGGWGQCEGGWLCYGGFGHPELASREQKFIDEVPTTFEELVTFIREDKDEFERMGAIQLLAYGPDRHRVANALVPFVKDAAQGVRNEALRLVGAAQSHERALFIPLDPVLEALWYPLVSDRNKAAWTLVEIVEREEGRRQKDVILKKAGDPLIEMAGASQRTDHEPARRVLTTLSGRDFGGDVEAWRAWVASELTP